MNWQELVVGAIFFWAVWTIVRVFVPRKKSAGCASGDCACGPEVNMKKSNRFSLNR